MMACTPSSLRPVSVSETEKESGMVTLPSLSRSDLQVADVVIPELPDSLPFTLSDSLAAAAGETVDSLARKDSVVISDQSLLTTIDNFKEAAAKVKRDTTTMDSLELAVYKHNKAIDDSLALDSINRSRKSGIDSPVEYAGCHLAGPPVRHVEGEIPEHGPGQREDLHESRQQPRAR